VPARAFASRKFVGIFVGIAPQSAQDTNNVVRYFH
jgi:hypothetical protein